jgi:hypothetical protein
MPVDFLYYKIGLRLDNNKSSNNQPIDILGLTLVVFRINYTVNFLEFISRKATSPPNREETMDAGITKGRIIGIKS